MKLVSVRKKKYITTEMKGTQDNLATIPIGNDNADDIDESTLFLAETQFQGHIVKALFEIIKASITDTNLRISKDSIVIKSMDVSHTVLIHAHLNREGLDKYFIDIEDEDAELRVGLNVKSLYTQIKTLNRDEILTLFIDKEKTNRIGIRVWAAGDPNIPGSSWVTERYLSLLDVNEEELAIDEHEYKLHVNIPADRFQKFCRELKNVPTENISIIHKDNTLILEAKGDDCGQRTSIPLNYGDDGSYVGDSNREDYHGSFSLARLSEFSKLNVLSNTVQLSMRSEHPLIMYCPVGEMGGLKICIAPNVESDD